MDNTGGGRKGMENLDIFTPASNPHYTQKRQLEMCIEIRNTGKVLLRILCNYIHAIEYLKARELKSVAIIEEA